MIAALLFLCGAMSASELSAQLPQTRLYAIFPPGSQVGTSVEVRLSGGVDLEEIDRLVFSHPGIKAVPKTADTAGKQTPVANTFVVTVEQSVPPGLYEVRASGLFGMSNPRTFVVASTKEAAETEPNNITEKANELTLNTTVNGQINGGADIDFFHFQGRKGDRVLVTCQADRIDSSLSAVLEVYDANRRRLASGRGEVRGDPLVDVTIPEDGRYFLKLYDFVYGGSTSHVYRVRADTGPHVDFILPPAGVPGSTGKFTLYGRNLPGSVDAQISVAGRPLEKLDVEIPVPAVGTNNMADFPAADESGLDGFSYVFESPQGNSNPVPMRFASAPPVIEQEPNDSTEQSQSLSVPGEVAGQFQAKGDIDRFTFEAKAGSVYYIEVFTDRNGSSSDPFFVLDQVIKNDKGEEQPKRITEQDDNTQHVIPSVFDARTDDPVYRFVVPADGTYRIALRDRYFESRGGPQFVYRLAIRKPKPDFRLVALPVAPVAPGTKPGAGTWAMGLRRGDNLPLQLFAFRRDGFAGTIDVSVTGLPAGVTCQGASIGTGQNSATMILSAADDAPPWSGIVQVTGEAKLEDPDDLAAEATARSAIKPATDAMAALEKAADQALNGLQEARKMLDAARKATAEKPDDEAIRKSEADAQMTLVGAAEAVATAVQQRAAGQKRVTEAQAKLQAAVDSRAAQVRYVGRTARAATVVKSGQPTQPARSRVARTLGLSVLKEQAPYQVSTDALRFEVHQSRQLLIPVKLIKRGGFDNKVALTFAGLPAKTNIDIENKAIEKGKDNQLLRVFVKKNARVGTYTLHLHSQGDVAYRRNPEKAERAKAEQAKAAEGSKQAAEAAKQTVAARDVAVKTFATDSEALAKATTLKEGAATKLAETEKMSQELKKNQALAEKEVSETSAVAKKAAESQLASEKKANAAADAAQKALDAKEAAKKLAEEAAEAAKKAAQAQAVAEKEANEAARIAQQAAEEKQKAEKQAAAAAVAAKQAADKKAAVEKEFAESQAQVKQAAEVLAGAQKMFETANATSTKSKQAKDTAETEVKQAEAKAKSLEAAKKAADKLAVDAEKAAQPKKITIFPPSTPVIIEVKKGPATLSVSAPNKGEFKRGEQLDVKVKVKRINGFKGPLMLSLPLPSGVTGLFAKPVTIPADKDEAVLSVIALADATTGDLPHVVVRATMEFDGKAVVDANVKLKVAE
jgi:hypothetical protein